MASKVLLTLQKDILNLEFNWITDVTSQDYVTAMASKKSDPPPGYVPGLGRGATGFTTRSDVGPVATTDIGSGSRSAEARAAQLRHADDDEQGQYQHDAEDDEADQIWAAVEEKLKNRRKRKNGSEQQLDGRQQVRARITAQFQTEKAALAKVSEDEWNALPDSVDSSLQHRNRIAKREFMHTDAPVSDSLLEHRSKLNQESSLTAQAANARANDDGMQSTALGLSAARGQVLGLSLDRAQKEQEHDGTKTEAVDKTGYLTSLATSQRQQALDATANIQDISKARLLLKSVRTSQPRHASAWLAAARVEEAAGKIWAARKLCMEACEAVGDSSSDVWLEWVRLSKDVSQKKQILSTAVRKLPRAVGLWLQKAAIESSPATQQAVLRTALEANPTSLQLWKAAIDKEKSAGEARVLLALAVEQVPSAVELWLALAQLEDNYQQAQRVLNRARQAVPTEPQIWLAAAQLEESHGKDNPDLQTKLDTLLSRAVASLTKKQATITRDQWLSDAEKCETKGYPGTAAAVIHATLAMGVADEDRYRTYTSDATATLQHGAVATARAILKETVLQFPRKKAVWNQSIQLEQANGDFSSLDGVLKQATQQLPNVEFFWLLRAKEHWLAGHVEEARNILGHAFEHNDNSEAVWLAAAKLERETGEIDRARFFLSRARERAPSGKVFMKSALLERDESEYETALELIEEGLKKYPQFAKLYMMGGQICADNLEPKSKATLTRARTFYERAIKLCPKNATLWILASRLEERAHTFTTNETTTTMTTSTTLGTTKSRRLLELARLQNPHCPELWLEAVKLEQRAAGNSVLASSLLAKAIQDCPSSGILRAQLLRSTPRATKKAVAAQCIQACPDDVVVLCAVAELFASERKVAKACKWLERAVQLDPSQGDSWARYYAVELQHGTMERQKAVKERCIAAEPKHGEFWAKTAKENGVLNIGQVLEVVVKLVQEQLAQERRVA